MLSKYLAMSRNIIVSSALRQVRLPRVGACSFQLRAVTLGDLWHTGFGMHKSSACGTDGVCIRI